MTSTRMTPGAGFVLFVNDTVLGVYGSPCLPYGLLSPDKNEILEAYRRRETRMLWKVDHFIKETIDRELY